MAYAVPTLEVDRSVDFTDDLLHNLYDMKTQEDMTDFTIKVNKVSIPCHSVVMSAASPYFKVLLRSSMKETTHREVELNNLDENYLRKVVDYCYTGKIIIHLDGIEQCIDIVEYLQLTLLKAQIEDFIAEHLSINNCISWFYQADTYSMNRLKKECYVMMISAFPDISKQPEFYQMPVNELLDVIQEVVKVVSTDIVLSACADWFKYNVGLRTDDFITLLNHIPLEQCSIPCKLKVLESHNPAWPNHEKFQQVLQVESSSFIGEKRPAASFIVLGGFTTNNVLNRMVYKVDLTKDKLDVLGKMPNTAVKYYGVYCSTPLGIFVLGGSTATRTNKPTTECNMLSFSDMEWTRCPRVLQEISCAAAICVNDHVYVMGAQERPENVFCYNLRGKRWSMCPDMPQACIHPVLGSICDRIYVIFNTNLCNDCFKVDDKVSLQCFDIGKLSWSKLCPLPATLENTSNASCVSICEHLYLVGGDGKLCARYSPHNDTWTEILQRPSHGHFAGSAFLIDNMIFLCGGKDYGTCINIIEAYDIQEDKWAVQKVGLPNPMKYHICATT